MKKFEEKAKRVGGRGRFIRRLIITGVTTTIKQKEKKTDPHRRKLD